MDPVKKLFTGFPLFVQLVLRVLCIVAIAELSYYAIETPFLRLKDQWGNAANRKSH